MSVWPAWTDGQLAEVELRSQRRRLRTSDGIGPLRRGPLGEVVSYASNDYLGLSHHPAVMESAHAAIERWGTGATSARLITGTRPIHVELEAELAEWRSAEAALVTATGYQANLSVLSTFGPGARIVSDERNHASIIDGARLARTEVTVYRHNDFEHAESLVASAPGRAVVVTDSVFSMDGDVAPLLELSTACAKNEALLVVDDAHAVFELPALHPEAVTLRVGTLSKALGSLGGFVTGSRSMIDLLTNRSRPFIFTTASPPASMAAALAAVRICRSSEGASLRARLRASVDALLSAHPSPIVAVVVGSEEAALAASGFLANAGIDVPAIRPPSVSAGSSRLRIALSSDHTYGQIAELVGALSRLGLTP